VGSVKTKFLNIAGMFIQLGAILPVTYFKKNLMKLTCLNTECLKFVTAMVSFGRGREKNNIVGSLWSQLKAVSHCSRRQEVDLHNRATVLCF